MPHTRRGATEGPGGPSKGGCASQPGTHTGGYLSRAWLLLVLEEELAAPACHVSAGGREQGLAGVERARAVLPAEQFCFCFRPGPGPGSQLWSHRALPSVALPPAPHTLACCSCGCGCSLDLGAAPEAPPRQTTGDRLNVTVEPSVVRATFTKSVDEQLVPVTLLEGLQEELDHTDELERILDGFGSSSSFDSEGEIQFEGEASAAPSIFCPFQKSFQCNTMPVGLRIPIPLGAHPPDLVLPWQQVVTAEVAEKNAQELVAEEERVKRKAEKKRLKKKKQKDRKRQEKREQELRSKQEAESTQPALNGTAVVVTLENGGTGRGVLPAPATGPLKPGKAMASPPELRPPHAPSSADTSTEEETEDELDLSSTFVSKARRKVGARPSTPRKERPARAGNKEPEPEPAAPPEVPRPVPDVSAAEQSMVLAEHGNAAAARGCYEEAVCCFTEAVKLNPRDYRLFGNRSYCYEKLQQHMEALSDAQVALSLQPHWPKGCFRKGKALMGLQRYAEAERTFEQLLQLDGSHADAAAQLEICRQQRSPGHSTGSWHGEPSIPIEALLRDMRSWSLLHGEQADASVLPDGAENTDSGFVTIVNPRNRAKGPARLEALAPTPTPTSSQLSRGWFAVWVGNVTSRITLKQLYAYFGPFGPIHSIRPIPEKFCAFVNYTQREAAERAFAAMQGAEVEGTKLVLQLKHPVHRTPPVTSAQRPLAREPVRPPPGLERPPQQSSGCVQHPPQSQGSARKPGPPR